MTFGARLTAARLAKKMTQTDLGKGLGTDGKDASKAVVYGWEKDQHFPRVDQLAMICDRLGVSSDYLLFGKVADGDLAPDVLGVAADINSLPPRQRKAVLMTVRSAVDLASTVLPQENTDTGADEQTPTIRRANG